MSPAARFVLVLAACGAGCAESSRAPRAPGIEERPTRFAVPRRTDLPLLDSDQPRPLIEVEVAGFGKAVWLVDTGAAFSWVSREFTQKHGIERHPLGASVVDIFGRESGISERVFLPSVRIGDLEVIDFKPPVFDSLFEDIDGSLGQDLLRKAFVVFDAPGKNLALLPLDSGTDVLADFGMGGKRAIGYALDWSSGVPRFTSHVKGLDAPLTFMIDTGTGIMTLPPEVIEALGLESIGTIDNRGISDIAQADTKHTLYDVPRLQLDLFSVHDNAFAAPHASLSWVVLRTMLFAFDNANDTLLLFVE